MNNSGLYIQLFSIHGLIRAESPELGYDADTGGQVKYVLELARTLATHPEVSQVDLVTRLIEDEKLSSLYARPIERLNAKARIIRIQCGGRRYLRKELLWPHLGEFTDNTLRLIKDQRRVPDIFHGHYADAGYVAMDLAVFFNAPFVFTGHSLGRDKKAKLLSSGHAGSDISKHYRIDKRIAVEEEIINKADLIITSTNQEIEKQYSVYGTRGKSFAVIPPGIDLGSFYPSSQKQPAPAINGESSDHTRNSLRQELQRFWSNPDKPFILALCRPDQRKNIPGLLEAYGTDHDLRAMANLAVFAGLRRDIMKMENNERNVITEMLLKMDYYDLYGKLAIPKNHDSATGVPELYRFCADSGGVFVNPAMVEPFGLTIIEASACGLPIIATNNGGPVDIVANCRNGILVDPDNPQGIATAIKALLTNRKKWKLCSRNGVAGVRTHYSWESHCNRAISLMKKLLRRKSAPAKNFPPAAGGSSCGHRLISMKKLLIADIDNTLTGDRERLSELLGILRRNRNTIAWGVATGRSLEMTLDILNEQHIAVPDIVICSVGTEIYYGPHLLIDKSWQHHINHRWRPGEIAQTLASLDFLTPQDVENQRHFKLSYFMENDKNLLIRVHVTLRNAGLSCQIIYSHGRYLDILPRRAAKGKALKHVRAKWGIRPEHVMVAGDSGNDEDMLSGMSRGLVVGNHSNELEHLRGRRHVFFSKHGYAGGIIDGLIHYKFLQTSDEETIQISESLVK